MHCSPFLGLTKNIKGFHKLPFDPHQVQGLRYLSMRDNQSYSRYCSLIKTMLDHAGFGGSMLALKNCLVSFFISFCTNQLLFNSLRLALLFLANSIILHKRNVLTIFAEFVLFMCELYSKNFLT